MGKRFSMTGKENKKEPYKTKQPPSFFSLHLVLYILSFFYIKKRKVSLFHLLAGESRSMMRFSPRICSRPAVLMSSAAPLLLMSRSSARDVLLVLPDAVAAAASAASALASLSRTSAGPSNNSKRDEERGGRERERDQTCE